MNLKLMAWRATLAVLTPLLGRKQHIDVGFSNMELDDLWDEAVSIASKNGSDEYDVYEQLMMKRISKN